MRTWTIDRRWRSGALALAGGVLLALLAACADGRAADERRADTVGTAAEPVSKRVINVEVVTVARQPFTEHVRVTGAVEARLDVTVAAEESGVVREVLADKGRYVRAGEPIARIDDSVLRPQVEETRAQAALARETYERRRRLWEEEQVGSELAYLEAKYAAQRSEAALKLLEERLERTTVRAPISGLLEDRYVEVGSLVAPGARVARLVDVDRLKIVGGVPERYAADIAPGAAAEVTLDVLDQRRFEGRVTFVGATVNEQNRTFPVEISIPNPGRVIKPQMVANVRLARRAYEQALVVPQEALVRVDDGFIVFVAVAREGAVVAEARRVELGAAEENRVLVRSGLEPGEKLVVVGQQQLAAGDLVNVVTER